MSSAGAIDIFDTPGAKAQPEPNRDRYGRYILPHPEDGKSTSWTRATTFAKSISDTYGLTQWKLRMALAGVGMRPDLHALVASTSIDDKKTFDRVANEAMEAAGSASGRNQGTALHSFTERVDRGEKLAVPAPWNVDVAAYTETMAAAGIVAIPNLIERIIVVPEYSVAGTFDRILKLPDHRLVIGDVKTGKDLSYGWLEIAIQLALYAHGAAIWDQNTGKYEPMPLIDTSIGIVMHLPLGAGKCDLYEVDLKAGWEAAKLCADVRSWRTRKNLARKLEPTNSSPAADLERSIVGAISEEGLLALWKTGMASGIWADHHTSLARGAKARIQAQSRADAA